VGLQHKSVCSARPVNVRCLSPQGQYFHSLSIHMYQESHSGQPLACAYRSASIRFCTPYDFLKLLICHSLSIGRKEGSLRVAAGTYLRLNPAM
jgi:hypothetical protein